MLKAVIVEDESKGMNNLKAQLSKYCENIEVIGTATSNEDALEMFEELETAPDVAFLDINLPDGLVFKMLDQLRPINFEIIFVTGYKEYAIKACEFASIGYILKPIDHEVLQEAVSRIRPNGKMKERLDIMYNAYNNPNAFEKLSISGVDGIYFVNLRDIVRFEAEDNYTHIYLNSSERVTASKTIKSYEDLLGPLNFYRVHKRHVINLNYIRKFVKGDGGYLIMDDGMKIEVSRRRRGAFMERLKLVHEVF